MVTPKTRPIPLSTIEKAIGQIAAGVEVGENEVATDIQIPDENITMKIR